MMKVFLVIFTIIFVSSETVHGMETNLSAVNITKSSANIKLNSSPSHANDTEGGDDDISRYRIVTHELTADGIPVAVEAVNIGINSTDELESIQVDDLKSFTHYNVCIEDEHNDVNGAHDNVTAAARKCVHFQTSYDPWNMEAIGAIAFCGFIITTFLIASICDMCVKNTPESEADERRFLVQKLIKERRRTNQVYGTDNVFEFSDDDDEGDDSEEEKMTEEDHALHAMMNFRHEDEICASSGAN